MTLVSHRMPNGRLNKKQVAVASRVLDQILERRGHLKPAYVVDAARPKASPIHPFFTWDNSAAAEKWREEEARSLIRSIRVVRDDVPLSEQPITRRFVSVNDADAFDGDAYLPIEDAMANDTYREQVISDALVGLKAWQERHDGLKEFVGVYSEISSIDRSLSARKKAKRTKSREFAAAAK